MDNANKKRLAGGKPIRTLKQRIARRKSSLLLSADIGKYYGLGQQRLNSIRYRHKFGVPCAEHPTINQ